jgi:hypothetical protein
LGRRDSNLCILESEFAKTLSPGAGLELAHLELKARPIDVTCDTGAVTSREAVSLGLIVTELILNALKHAFTDDRIDRQIAVAGTNWKLSVADNGIGAPVGVFAQSKSGLGTSIVNALAEQFEARVDVVSGRQGTSVLVTHATFAKMPNEMSREDGLFRPNLIRGHASSTVAPNSSSHLGSFWRRSGLALPLAPSQKRTNSMSGAICAIFTFIYSS